MTTEEFYFVFPSLDGLMLSGALMRPSSPDPAAPAVVLVHGITADKDEGGFYWDLAQALAQAGRISLRFDLRGHGHSEGLMRQTTVHGCLSDIRAAMNRARGAVEVPDHPILIGASFGGGLVTMTATRHKIGRLVLLNPNLDYALNWFGGAPLTTLAQQRLSIDGWFPHRGFEVNRAMANEILNMRPADYLPFIKEPVLAIHGTADTMVPIRPVSIAMPERGTFVPIADADHGFIEPGDEQLASPVTAAFRRRVIEIIVDWLQQSGD